jgi:GTP cyclohydrolase II
VIPIELFLEEKNQSVPHHGRPLITVSYAQSLDGSIALKRGRPFELSGAKSRVLTHRLRAAHDAVLVGIGTVLADNPRLTVRLVKGKSPRPIVLDSQLRFPLHANLLNASGMSPIVATTLACSSKKQKMLENAGAVVLRLEADSRGWVDLNSLLAALAQMGIGSVMVEGGARVITSFLSQHLADRIILTITPNLLGGLHALEVPLVHAGESIRLGEGQPRLKDFGYEQTGMDIVFWSRLFWENA